MRYIYRGLFILGMLVYFVGLSSCARDAQRHYQVGKWYYDKGLINEAILEYKEAVRLNPRLYPAHHGLALAYTKKGWYEYALKEAETSFDLHPTDEGYRLIQLIKEKQRMEPFLQQSGPDTLKP
jgi:tetratricopeptide (TPR) repeat protein